MAAARPQSRRRRQQLTRDQLPTIKTHNPQNVRANFPAPEDLGRIVTALPEYLRGVIAFAVTTAWRVKSMVLPLLWQHVDWKRQLITLPAELSKNKKPVKFPFGPLPELKRLLERQLASGEPVSASHVFHRPDGRGIDYKVMRTAWRAACRKAKCPGTWLHDLCRVGARNLRRAGVSESEVMKLGRWKTPSMFHRYDIIDEQDLNASVAKLAAALVAGDAAAALDLLEQAQARGLGSLRVLVDRDPGELVAAYRVVAKEDLLASRPGEPLGYFGRRPVLRWGDVHALGQRRDGEDRKIDRLAGQRR